MAGPEEGPEPKEPTEEQRSELGNSVDPAVVQAAITANPSVTAERINELVDEVNNDSYDPTTSPHTAEETVIYDALVKVRDDAIKTSAKVGDLELPTGSPKGDPLALTVEGDAGPVGEAGARNASKLRLYFREFIRGATLGLIDIGEGGPKPDGSPPDKPPVEDNPKNRTIIDKAIAKVKDLLDKEASPGKKKLYEALLAILPNVLTGLKLLFTLKKLKDFLEQIAKGMDECDEVNFSNHTQIKLECGDGSSDALKAACICPATATKDSPAAPALINMCGLPFDPAHTCPEYNYVYFEYHWYNVLPAVIAGLGKGPQDILDWFVKNKWTFIIGGVVILLFIFIFGLIKHYAFK